MQTVIASSEELRPCVGCFGCWVRTPGLCVITGDRANEISSYEMTSDIVVLLTRLTYGGYSADVKAFLDRSIPNILPFFEIYKGEMHHEMRYQRFPLWFTVGYGDATPRERNLFKALADRHALNLRPAAYTALTVPDATGVGDIAGALSALLSKEVGA